MNKREIDEMMAHLPSQQKEETLTQKVLIAIIFLMFLVFWMWVPDFEADCFDQFNQRVSCETIAK
jgi:hypothetical protein